MCAANVLIEAGNIAGVTVDPLGNVFTAFYLPGAPGPTFVGVDLRGYEASIVAPGSSSAKATSLAVVPSGVTTLVADGVHLIYQSLAGSDPGDLGIQDYIVDTSTHSVAPVGTTRPFMLAKTPKTNFWLVVDPSGRLWIGANLKSGSSIFFVLQEHPS
jgi:hypothetical protein